jgi:hypothetical protein
VAEHFDAEALAARSADILLVDGAMDGSYLLEVEFAGEDHHIGKLCIEAQRFRYSIY